MRSTYKGKYKLKNPEKYRGDINAVTYRSLWERQAFRWCESRPDVVKWSSEEMAIPYTCGTDGKKHLYYIDLWIKYEDGRECLIEIKPKSQTKPPEKKKRVTRKYLTEVNTYVKNVSKWKAAMKVASRSGMEFQIWTEDTLKALGIRIVTK